MKRGNFGLSVNKQNVSFNAYEYVESMMNNYLLFFLSHYENIEIILTGMSSSMVSPDSEVLVEKTAGVPSSWTWKKLKTSVNIDEHS